MDDLPIHLFTSEQAWQQWIEEHHTTSQGVWLKIAKRDGGEQSVSYAQALDTALCFGWIDGQKGKLDAAYYLQRFTPRRRKSLWSAVNRDKADALIAAGKMREAGLRQIESAKLDGRWEAAYQPQSRMTVPDDFHEALNRNEAARLAFEALNSVNRYAILYRIQNVKKAESRQRKIAEFIDMLAEGRRIHE